ncbi:XrtA system polysaccharide chain length determinant [Sphingomonas japonica]|uniref:Polysaccharide chain length determinant protein (PEP-CTERM system associated) n=1 Tax=Sphingomonas japonica TaxID=511662 RepID=A0ABX0U6J7_9SPHN|nr:XrtA system polysaccharide chain length determinant [Sphingomonas japonica]NIJ25031.1 polysaccharide chain length determinant protein (PEP-CTERM system associated) [Sphingomonas japonica]
MNGLIDELRIALHQVWARRWVALGVAWGLCLVGWLVVTQIPNRFESTAKVSVQLRSILPQQTGVNAEAEATKDIDRVRQTLTSAISLEKVVRGTDLAKTVSSDRDVAARIATLQKNIKITAQPDNLFDISATVAAPSLSDSENAALARAVVQKLIDIFVEGNLASGRDETGQSLRFLDEQVAEREKALQEADLKRADFQNQFLGTLPGTGTLNERVNAARAQIAQVENDLAAARSSLAAVAGQMSGTDAAVGGSGGIAVAGPARARLAAIEGQLAEARGRGWTASHPDVIALNNQLAAARAAAQREPTTIQGGAGGSANPLYLSLRSMQAERGAQVAALEQRRAQLQSDLQMLQDKIASEPGVAAEQAEIDRNYQVLKDQYDKLLTDREQMRLRSQVQSGGDAVKFTVLDPPSSPRAPIAPNRPLLMAAVLIVALGLGVAIAFALSRLNSTFPTAQRLEKLSGMPVIGSIGEVVTEAQTALRRKRMKTFAGAAGGLGVAFLVLLGIEFVQLGMIA